MNSRISIISEQPSNLFSRSVTKTVVSVLFFCTVLTAKAQEPQWPLHNFSAGYYGNFATNPGVSATWDLQISSSVIKKDRIRRGRTRSRFVSHRLLVGPQLGLYIDPHSHGGSFGTLQLTYQRIAPRGWFIATSVGAGGYASYLTNVYDATDPNQILHQKNGAFVPYFAPSFSFQFGKLKVDRKQLSGGYVQLHSLFLTNYNAGLLPLPALGIGSYF